ncbi:MAG: SDR family oxidoreductase [Cyclobacteriaceae bacterium]|nr:SDR family oxidoreductase [Cyclobacteriaceae bacterium HetDA_MAG_MS6]
MFSLKGKTALVTGGASGIGKAISEVLARAGAATHILELNMDSAQNTADVIKNIGGNATAHQCNVADGEQVKEIVDSVQQSSSIDILINNAGIAHVGNVEATSEKDLDKLYEVNIKGVYHGMKACIPHFKTNGGGVIINMASIASSIGLTDRFAYSMTKGAVLTMTMSVAKDYVQDGIRCNSISPARVHTPFVDGFIAKNYPDNQEEMFDKLSKYQPIGRMGRPEEVAHLALYLCSDEASFITGTDYPIDGGCLKLMG